MPDLYLLVIIVVVSISISVQEINGTKQIEICRVLLYITVKGNLVECIVYDN